MPCGKFACQKQTPEEACIGTPDPGEPGQKLSIRIHNLKNGNASMRSKWQFLNDWKRSVQDIFTKWLWLPALLSRMALGIFFIQAGWDKTHHLTRSKDILGFFGIGVPAKHSGDPFFPCVEILCGGLLLLGFLTRFAAALLFGLVLIAILDMKVRELAGLSFSGFQSVVISALLAGICAAGAGPVSLDRFISKQTAGLVQQLFRKK